MLYTDTLLAGTGIRSSAREEISTARDIIRINAAVEKYRSDTSSVGRESTLPARPGMTLVGLF